MTLLGQTGCPAALPDLASPRAGRKEETKPSSAQAKLAHEFRSVLSSHPVEASLVWASEFGLQYMLPLFTPWNENTASCAIEVDQGS